MKKIQNMHLIEEMCISSIFRVFLEFIRENALTEFLINSKFTSLKYSPLTHY